MYATRRLVPYIDLFSQTEQIRSSGKIRSVGFLKNEEYVIILALIELTIFSG